MGILGVAMESNQDLPMAEEAARVRGTGVGLAGRGGAGTRCDGASQPHIGRRASFKAAPAAGIAEKRGGLAGWEGKSLLNREGGLQMAI